MYVHVSGMQTYVHMSVGICRSQKGAYDPLELELTGVWEQPNVGARN